jgi:hypothetical protein
VLVLFAATSPYLVGVDECVAEDAEAGLPRGLGLPGRHLPPDLAPVQRLDHLGGGKGLVVIKPSWNVFRGMVIVVVTLHAVDGEATSSIVMARGIPSLVIHRTWCTPSMESCPVTYPVHDRGEALGVVDLRVAGRGGEGGRGALGPEQPIPIIGRVVPCVHVAVIIPTCRTKIFDNSGRKYQEGMRTVRGIYTAQSRKA